MYFSDLFDVESSGYPKSCHLSKVSNNVRIRMNQGTTMGIFRIRFAGDVQFQANVSILSTTTLIGYKVILVQVK